VLAAVEMAVRKGDREPNAFKALIESFNAAFLGIERAKRMAHKDFNCFPLIQMIERGIYGRMVCNRRKFWRGEKIKGRNGEYGRT